LFFVKGQPTKEIWYYEHPYPEGYKSYSKTKPIRIQEFEPEKAWWTSRTENEHAWRVSINELVANGYNLDIKNPHIVLEDMRDPEDLLEEYQKIREEVTSTLDALKLELTVALGLPNNNTHS